MRLKKNKINKEINSFGLDMKSCSGTLPANKIESKLIPNDT